MVVVLSSQYFCFFGNKFGEGCEGYLLRAGLGKRREQLDVGRNSQSHGFLTCGYLLGNDMVHLGAMELNSRRAFRGLTIPLHVVI